MADQQSPDNDPTAENATEAAQPVPGEDAAEAPPTEAQPTVSQPVEQVAYSEEAAPTEMIGPSQPGRSPRERTIRRGLLVGGAIVLVAALAFGLMQIMRKDAPPPTVQAAAAEVFLEPATDVGDSPFSPTSFATEQPAPTNPGTDPLPPPPPAPAPGDDTVAMAVRTANGDVPGLFGGTADVTTCDATLLIDYLAQNPQKGQAWSSVHRIKPDQIPAYVTELTPVLLRTDTRVTDHGYIDVAQALPRQAVLQAGTAVLVDKYGSPRVRCLSGSPLLDPVAVTAAAPARQAAPAQRQAAPPAGAPVVRQVASPAPRVVFVGPRWPRFDPLTLVVIRRVLRIIDLFVLWDFRRGALFGRQLGILIRDIIDLANPRLRRLIPPNLLLPARRLPAVVPPLQAPRQLPAAPPVQALPALVPPVQQAPAPAPQKPPSAPAPAVAPAPQQPALAPAPQPPSAPPPYILEPESPIYEPDPRVYGPGTHSPGLTAPDPIYEPDPPVYGPGTHSPGLTAPDPIEEPPVSVPAITDPCSNPAYPCLPQAPSAGTGGHSDTAPVAAPPVDTGSGSQSDSGGGGISTNCDYTTDPPSCVTTRIP